MWSVTTKSSNEYDKAFECVGESPLCEVTQGIQNIAKITQKGLNVVHGILGLGINVMKEKHYM